MHEQILQPFLSSIQIICVVQLPIIEKYENSYDSLKYVCGHGERIGVQEANVVFQFPAARWT